MPGWAASGFDDSAWGAAIGMRPPKGQLRAQVSPPDRVIETRRIAATEPVAASRVYSFDAGCNVAGLARLRATGARGAQTHPALQRGEGPGLRAVRQLRAEGRRG